MKAKRPLVFGHRGARGLMPENTLAAFEHAIAIGVDGVEMDVMRCAGGEAVVFHDYRLEQLAGHCGWTESTSLATLKRLDVGGHFHHRHTGEKIPTLDETLDLIRDRVIVNIELKGEQATPDGLEATVVEAVRRFKLTDSVVVSSFNPIRLMRLAKIAPEIATGMLMIPDWADRTRWFFFANAARALFCNPEISMSGADFVANQKRKGRLVVAWPANTMYDMTRLIKSGVDGIITDRPDILLNMVRH